MNLLKISLTISILGILLLLFLASSQKPKQVNSYQELSLGEYVKTTAKIISTNSYGSFSVIKLDNNITLTCNCKFKQNKTIITEGKVSEYKNKLQINAEQIHLTNQNINKK